MSTRATHAGTLNDQLPAKKPNGMRAKACQVISGHVSKKSLVGTQAKVAAVYGNPVLNGPNVREAIRVFVSVDKFKRCSIITYSKITLARRDDAEIRTEVSVTTIIAESTGEDKYGLVETTITGRNGARRIHGKSSVSRAQSRLDLGFFDQYVKKVKEYRDSPEFQNDLDLKQLPVKQAAEFNGKMTTTTLAATLPFGLTVKPAVLVQDVAPRAAAFTRWSATYLTKQLGKKVEADAISDLAVKGAQALGFPKALDKLQEKWGVNYADPRVRPLCVYADLRMGGQSIYRQDVSPTWVKTAHQWLYELVFGTLEIIL